jgi:prepilin-type N-terminal cleavage/methylation domain-containing protein
MQRRTTRAALHGQRGMTLLEILIVLAILGLVMGVLVGPRLYSMFS